MGWILGVCVVPRSKTAHAVSILTQSSGLSSWRGFLSEILGSWPPWPVSFLHRTRAVIDPAVLSPGRISVAKRQFTKLYEPLPDFLKKKKKIYIYIYIYIYILMFFLLVPYLPDKLPQLRVCHVKREFFLCFLEPKLQLNQFSSLWSLLSPQSLVLNPVQIPVWISIKGFYCFKVPSCNKKTWKKF